MTNTMLNLKNTPRLTLENYDDVQNLIVRHIMSYNDRDYYDYYMGELIKSQDCNILEQFMGYYSMVNDSYSWQTRQLKEDFSHNIDIFNITRGDSGAYLMGLWVSDFNTFEKEAMEHLKGSSIENVFQYLTYNRANQKLANIIDSMPYDDSYRKKYYEFIMQTLQNGCYDVSKNVRTTILSNNLMNDFLSILSTLSGHSMNTEKFFEGLDVPETFKLGVII